MLKRYITKAAGAVPQRELAPEQRKSLRKQFNPLAARRLTDLPLLLGDICKDAEPNLDDEWVFASAFGGALSLERYLESFPTPSPLHFQNSIQPGPLDLVNVARGKPARLLMPVVGDTELFADALFAAMISPNQVVHTVGGEEYSPWTASHELGAEHTFAWYLKLVQSTEAAAGEITFTPNPSAKKSESIPLSESVPELINSGRELEFSQAGRGYFRIVWN
ncbi:MAG: hypothetical protein AAFX93_16935 [Verrucomicrobiota bacterium]